jgi:hypothetical protein
MGRVVRFTMVGLLAGGLLAVSGTARTTGAGGVPAPAAFRLGDGSAGCGFDGERLACRSASMTSAVVLDGGGSSPTDDVDVVWTSTTPVLRQTESWWHAGFSCAVDDGAIVCSKGRKTIAVGPRGFGGASSLSDP